MRVIALLMVASVACGHAPVGDRDDIDVDAAVRPAAVGTPRICKLLRKTEGMCWGKPPVQGELAWVVGPREAVGNRGQIEIGEVVAEDALDCKATYWAFDVIARGTNLDGIYETRAKDFDKEAEARSGAWAVLDLELGATAAVVDSTKVVGPDGDAPWLALDRGTGASEYVDFIVSSYACDAAGKRLALYTYGDGGHCIQYWERPPGGSWATIRTDIVPGCPAKE